MKFAATVRYFRKLPTAAVTTTAMSAGSNTAAMAQMWLLLATVAVENLLRNLTRNQGLDHSHVAGNLSRGNSTSVAKEYRIIAPIEFAVVEKLWTQNLKYIVDINFV